MSKEDKAALIIVTVIILSFIGAVSYAGYQFAELMKVQELSKEGN